MVTEGSHWRESLKGTNEGNPRRCSFPWSQSWEMHAALLIPVFHELIRNRVLEKWHTKEENILDPLKLNIPWHQDRNWLMGVAVIWYRGSCDKGLGMGFLKSCWQNFWYERGRLAQNLLFCRREYNRTKTYTRTQTTFIFSDTRRHAEYGNSKHCVMVARSLRNRAIWEVMLIELGWKSSSTQDAEWQQTSGRTYNTVS